MVKCYLRFQVIQIHKYIMKSQGRDFEDFNKFMNSREHSLRKEHIFKIYQNETQSLPFSGISFRNK